MLMLGLDTNILIRYTDFSDLLLGETNQLHGCETTITLDKKASETDTFQLLTEE